MAEPYLGEIRLFANNFVPQGWMLCQGQLLSIQQNTALYSLLGTTYGGDGKTTFALPDLQGRVPIHFNTNFPLGEKQGETTHTLTTNEMPTHTHTVSAASVLAASPAPTNNVWANTNTNNLYGPATSLTQMNSGAVTVSGGSQAHQNMQPYLAVNFGIAIQGVFPPRN